MIDAGVFGATGYTGQALLDILLFHPGVNVTALASGSSAGKTLAEVFPQYSGLKPLVFQEPNAPAMAEMVDVVFLCLPHKEAMAVAPVFLEAGKKVFDLSADFRLKDPAVYEQWYKTPHSAPRLLESAVYGQPETRRGQIAAADLIAVPGCYPTSAILGLAPVIDMGWLNRKTIVINSVSGVSGAGKKLESQYMLSELEGNFFAYGAPTHRHTPEIEQELSLLAGENVIVTFIPHLLPTTRGIYTTITADLLAPVSPGKVFERYVEYYRDCRFVHAREGFPQMKWAVGGSNCFVSATVDERANRLIVTSTIDNLLKGAAGQAVQCFNIRHGLDEAAGLR
ncbi:MAG: N-acetyl-gamma-glutamyl-phosphate reductase [Nitrospinae bacterium]|nr:N-acetyl-gamma-glutamyl-phosphate reductase [Nitrospinota bacterium]